MKNDLNFLIEKYDFEFKKNFKKVYSLIYDKKIISFENLKINKKEFKKIKKIVNKIIEKKDITFDIGHKYFRNIKIKISKGVFVPQYVTEQIVDITLEKINNGTCLEVGSGTGAISISLSNESNLKITSIDINKRAINLSKKNDITKKVDFILQDFFKYNPNIKYDLLISNPPYISKSDKNIDDWVKKNQPKNSLFANDDGLIFYKNFFSRASELLNDNSFIIVEIGFDQAKKISKLAKDISNDIEIIKDYEGFDRFIVVKYHEKWNN